MSGLLGPLSNKYQQRKSFLPFISEIRFPHYKTLEPDLCITFDWPITALVGPNGSNKSSILQAISSAPEGRSLAEFWFSTEVDNIDEMSRRQAQHRFIYKYEFDRSGMKAEVRKYRGSKKFRGHGVPKSLIGKNDPDYWEPTKSVKVDRMTPVPQQGFDNYVSGSRDRWNPIVKNVIYLDLRSELSAFDKFIHHQSFSHWVPNENSKRMKLIEWSEFVAKALKGRSLPKAKKADIMEPARSLKEETVKAIASILGKPINKIVLLGHRFFKSPGFTVKLFLEGDTHGYSEAHAGSGEFAVVRIVERLHDAPPRSLILLDEPEVSLHPGAQRALMNFLMEEILRNGHQVVLTTHSPVIAECLPDCALKVLGFDSGTKNVRLLADGCSPAEAFAHLGHITSDSANPKVLVEDRLAEHIVRTALRNCSPKLAEQIDVIPFSGGAQGIVKKVLPALSLADVKNTAIMLDGDQLPDIHGERKAKLRSAESIGDFPELEKVWKSCFHSSVLPDLHQNSDGSGKVENLKKCLAWADRCVGFLPGQSPEEALAREYFRSHKFESDHDPSFWKEFWENQYREKYKLAEREQCKSGEILSFQKACLAEIPKESEFLRAIDKETRRIISW